MQPKPYICACGQGAQLTTMGVTIEHKVPSGATGGKWSMLEYTAPPLFEGPVAHFHKILEETFYVLQGTLTVQAGSDVIEAAAGSVIVVPPGTVHKFFNNTDQPVHFMLLMTPGGFEGYFEELVALRKQEPQWPPANPQKLAELLQRFDTYAPVL